MNRFGESRDNPSRAVRLAPNGSEVFKAWRYERALLLYPAGTSTLGHYRASILLSAKLTASAPTRTSGLNHTAHPFTVYASQDGFPHHARLAVLVYLAGAPI